MLEHLLRYLPSRIAPALSGVIVLAVLTRILPTEEYGRLALGTALMIMLQSVFMQWLSLGLIRFHAAEKNNEAKNIISASVAMLFFLEAPFVLAICSMVAFFVFDSWADRNIVFIAFIYYLAFSLFNLSQRQHVSNFFSARFSRNSVFQSTLSGSLAILLPLFIAPTAIYALTGITLGLVFALVIDSAATSNLLRLSLANTDIMRRIVAFAWPTIPQAGLVSVIGRIDRFILTAIVGVGAVGQYNAGFSLVDQVISSIFLLVALVAHPMAISKYEQESPQTLRLQLSNNLSLMIGLGLPASLGLIAVKSELSQIILGQAFVQSATDLIPIFVAALFISGIKDHYIAHSFHLAKKMWLPIIILVPVAIGSIVANYMLIPDFGIMGAAYVMLVSQSVALVLSYLLTKWAIPMPFNLLDTSKIILATIFMSVIIFSLPDMQIWISLGIKIFVGITSYIVIIFIFNPSSIRQQALDFFDKQT